MVDGKFKECSLGYALLRANWLTSESILNHADHATIRYERKAKQLVNELMDKESLKMKTEKKEPVKTMDIKSIGKLEDGRFKLVFNDDTGSCVAKPEKTAIKKYASVDMYCSLSKKIIDVGEEYYLFRLKRSKDKQKGYVLLSEISGQPQAKEKPEQAVIQSIASGSKRGKYKVEWSIGDNAYTSDIYLYGIRTKSKRKTLTCAISGRSINSGEIYSVFQVSRNGKLYYFNVTEGEMPKEKQKTKEKIEIKKIKSIDTHKQNLTLLLSNGTEREVTYHKHSFKEKISECYFTGKVINPGDTCYRAAVTINGKQITFFFHERLYADIVDRAIGLKQQIDQELEDAKEKSMNKRNNEKAEDTCQEKCKYEPDAHVIKYSGYALFMLALIFIAWQNT